MKIVVDGMGGDHAPETAVEGAVLAAREYNTGLILTGVPIGFLLLSVGFKF